MVAEAIKFDEQETRRNELARCTNTVLEDSDLISGSISRLDTLFENIVGYGERKGWRGNDKILKNGIALSAKTAAGCLMDFGRTQVFLRGLRDAIKEAQKRFPGQKIRVLYAGTGPFGTLATPLTSQFSPDEVEFTALEIQEISIECLKKVIKAFGIENYFANVIKTDATKYQHKGPRPHIVVTETMNKALMWEPHAAITANLEPQMEENGIFVPEDVAISLFLSPSDNDTDELEFGRKDIGVVARLRRDSRLGADKRFVFDSAKHLYEPHGVYLNTGVHVFGKHVLTERDESCITEPLYCGTVFNGSSFRSMVVRYDYGDPLVLKVEEKENPDGTRDIYVLGKGKKAGELEQNRSGFIDRLRRFMGSLNSDFLAR